MQQQGRIPLSQHGQGHFQGWSSHGKSILAPPCPHREGFLPKICTKPSPKCPKDQPMLQSSTFSIIFWYSSPIIHFLSVYFTFQLRVTPLLVFNPLLASATTQLLFSHHDQRPAASHTPTLPL